ncbi:MAG: MarC family protein [Candidatus Micrarchaeota archaeon]|nr:MarC family protein [Candidatus Micrarchaeota archaeon]
MVEFEIALTSIITAYIALFVVMDPFTSVPVFLTLTKKFTQQKKREAANIAAVVATGVLLGFLFVGPLVLQFMGIRLESFEIGGGILMLLISLSFALGINMGKTEEAPVEAVIIGVPLLAGPGTMLTSILLANTIGFYNVLIAGILTCITSYLILLASTPVYKIIGKNGLEIMSRVMGVLLAAFAVEFIRKGFGM